MVVSALVDMYAKCGSIKKTRKIFICISSKMCFASHMKGIFDIIQNVGVFLIFSQIIGVF